MQHSDYAIFLRFLEIKLGKIWYAALARLLSERRGESSAGHCIWGGLFLRSADPNASTVVTYSTIDRCDMNMFSETPLRTLTRHPKALAVLAVALSLLFGFYRIASERHYGRMYVRVPGDVADDASIMVFVRNSVGEISPLASRAEDQRLFSRDAGWQRIQSVVITGNQLSPPDKARLEVRIGPGWRHTSALAIKEVREVSPDIVELAEHRRRFLFDRAWEVVVEPYRSSIFGWNTGVINWQGDAMLLAHVVTQGLAAACVLLLLTQVLRMLASQPRVMSSDSGLFGRIAGVVTEVFRIVLLVLFGHLCWSWFSSLASVRESQQYIYGILAAAGLACLFSVWFRIVARTDCERHLLRRMAALAALMFLLKLGWLSTVNFVPRSDYLEYYRYGVQVASGDWDAVRRDPSSAVAPLYLRRSFVFAAPVAFVVGPSITGFEFANVIVQCLTVFMFCVLVRRISGTRTAAYALPWLLVYPEFWYQAGTVTHNVAGYFLMMATWLSVDSWMRHAERQRMHGEGRAVCVVTAVIRGVVTGTCSGLLELTKSYGPMFEAGLVIGVIAGPIIIRICGGNGQALLRAGWMRWIFVVMALGTHHLLTARVDTYLLERSELRSPSVEVASLLSSVESAGPGGGESLAVWMDKYFRRVPEVVRTSLLLRKLLHEKLGETTEFVKCIFRKNSILSGTVDAMGYSQDFVTPVNAQPRVDNVILGTFQYTLSNAVLLGLGMVVFLRVLVPGPLLNSAFTLFPAVTSTLVLLVIYTAVESHPYYALNFLFPFCWLAGTLVCRLRTADAVGYDGSVGLRRLLIPAPRLQACLVIGVLLGVYCVIGATVDRSGLTFHRITLLSASNTSGSANRETMNGLPEFADAGTSRVHGWLEFRTMAGRILKGQRIEQRFEVYSQSGPLRGLCFFISGNARARIDKINRKWRGLPVQYSVSVGSTVLMKDRPIEELANPRFVIIPAEVWGQAAEGAKDRVTVTVSLESTSDVAIGRVSPPPAIAVEYFF